jgi:ribosomal protein S18 acetylase RimI-like enzyme
MIHIKKISAADTYPIRLEILRKNIPLPYKFTGDLDSDTFHLGVFQNSKIIAVSSFMKVKNNNFSGEQFQLRGMATLIEFQGLGAGRLMMQEALSILRALNIDCLWCNARLVAIEFYKKAGLQTFGEKFTIPYIGDHYLMFIDLK